MEAVEYESVLIVKVVMLTTARNQLGQCAAFSFLVLLKEILKYNKEN